MLFLRQEFVQLKLDVLPDWAVTLQTMNWINLAWKKQQQQHEPSILCKYKRKKHGQAQSASAHFHKPRQFDNAAYLVGSTSVQGTWNFHLLEEMIESNS